MKQKEIIKELLVSTVTRYNQKWKEEKNIEFIKVKNLGVTLERVIKKFFECPKKHQRCVNLKPVNKYWKRYKVAILKEIRQLDNVENFEQIIEKVKKIFKAVNPKTTADLMIYDLAIYIGVFKDLLPKEYVYVQRGASDGAKSLTKILNYIENNEEEYIKDGKIEVALLPQTFKELKPYEFENYLCRYKDELGMIVSIFKIDETDKANKIDDIINQLLEDILIESEAMYICMKVNTIKNEEIKNIASLFYNSSNSKSFKKIFKAYIGFSLFTKIREKNNEIDLDSVKNGFEFFLRYNKILT